MSKDLKSVEVDIGIKINLMKLLATRIMIQASSGGGKSYLIRKLAEVCVPHVQVIMLDVEGEFSTLREKFPFALVGKDGEIPLSVRYAETLAHKLLETNLSAIIDLSEMEKNDRRLFVKKFLNALIESPKNLWHPCLLIVDEGDTFCPEGKDTESTNAVISVGSKGRKRGLCLCIATQRLAKLAKDVTADLLNKLIGLTGQDIDRKRAGEEIGFASKEDVRGLLQLQPGEFYAVGPAVGFEVKKFKVLKATTTHLEGGSYNVTKTATPNAIKSIVSKLEDIPEEAEKEINTKKEYEQEIKRLHGEITQLKRTSTIASSSGKPDTKKVHQLENKIQQLKEEVSSFSSALHSETIYCNTLKKYLQGLASISKNISASLLPKLTEQIDKLQIVIPENNNSDNKKSVHNIKTIPTLPKSQAVIDKARGTISVNKTAYSNNENYSSLSKGSGDFRILRAAAMFYPDSVSKVRIGALANLKPSGGSFNTYISKLKTMGALEGSGNTYTCTDEGYRSVEDSPGGVPDLPDDFVEFWREILGPGSGCGRILSFLKEQYPEPVTKEQIGEATGMVPSGGSFNTYISKLNSSDLIKKTGHGIALSSELFK